MKTQLLIAALMMICTSQAAGPARARNTAWPWTRGSTYAAIRMRRDLCRRPSCPTAQVPPVEADGNFIIGPTRAPRGDKPFRTRRWRVKS